jgi:replicative DNA helicase
LNRGNYETDISQAAFKESGGIEYSSDLLLGLQFQALDPAIKKQAFDHDAEMAANPREVQLKIIKQRDGIAGARVNFKYHAAYNVFEEAGF